MDRTELENAKEHDVELRTIRKEHRNAIAFAHALGLQQSRETIALLIEIGIGGDMAVENHRWPLRPLLCPGTQIFGQRDLAVRVLWRARDPFWPRLVPQRVQLLHVFFFTEARGHSRLPSYSSETKRQRRFMVGSSATRIDSPSVLNASAVNKIASPGGYICSGAISMFW